MRTIIKFFGLSIVLICGTVVPGISRADLGDFSLSKDCPATTSLRSNKNSGAVTVKSGETYSAVKMNKPGGAYLLLRIPDARPNLRWVELACGTLGGGASGPGNGSQTPGGDNGTSGKAGKFLLAVSWQPAFCESSAGQGKKECVNETEQSFDATHFTLHGLWPQPRGNDYCNVPANDRRNDEQHNWNALPEPALTPQARAELDKIMPGTQSKLHRHEWIKHGTCFGAGPEVYFRTASALMNQINGSQLQRFVQANVGNAVDASALRDAFEQTFGTGSADALTVECSQDNGRGLISGFSITLQGVLNQASQLQNVLDTSATPRPKCARGEIDTVGAN